MTLLPVLLAGVLAMVMRKRTGTAARYGNGEPLPCVPPADELRNADVAAPAAVDTRPPPRRRGGQLTPEGARLLGRAGGIARAAQRAREQAFASRVRMVTNLPGFVPSAYYAVYAAEAEPAFHALLAQLAQQSDGMVSAAVSSVARSAIMQTYAGRWIMDFATGAFAFGKDADGKPTPNAALMLQGSRLLEAGRQSQIACFHLQQLESEARARTPGGTRDPQDALRASLGVGGDTNNEGGG